MGLVPLILLFIHAPGPNADDPLHPGLQELAADFYQWRTVQQPSGGDDIPRVERPAHWIPRFSPDNLKAYDKAWRDYRKKLDAIDPKGLTRSQQVDWLLLRSAMERVNWELNVLRAPSRNPDFYAHQTLGALYELLLIQEPWDQARIEHYIRVLASIPDTLAHARINLTDPIKPFARIAMGTIKDADAKLKQVHTALTKLAPESNHEAMLLAADVAGQALTDYGSWLEANLDGMSTNFTVGRDSYVYFLKNIALIPATPEVLLERGRQEWHRSVSFEVYAQTRNAKLPEQKIFPNARAQIIQEAADELQIRNFLEDNNIMTVPSWMKHYLNAVTPAHIEPLAHMGVVDDLTGPSRLHRNAVSFIPEPREGLSFFREACAKDPRPIIVHEGVPGHYYQMARSWKNPNPIRRFYIDSGANEGIGFYVEEMLLQHGLFDDRPRTLEILYRFMRLRALRVEVDIQLALGTMSIEEVGDYLADAVPMDRPTAVEEAGFFAMVPGQAITYQIGKTQIFRFLSDARIKQGDAFNLRHFHDYMMVNGNVPIALQRWEYLELDEPLPFWD